MPTFGCPHLKWWCARNRGRRSYWKLPCKKHTTIRDALEIMRSGYSSKLAKKERAMELLHRHERDLLNYYHCSKAELQSFAASRGLQKAQPLPSGKSDLVDLLEQADDDASFTKLLDLPPELRVRIYELHFEALPSIHTPVQPPLVQASKLIREESLPVFYQTCRFGFLGSDRTFPITLYPSDQRFLARTSDLNVSRIQRLELSYSKARVELLPRSSLGC